MEEKMTVESKKTNLYIVERMIIDTMYHMMMPV